jgi:hypothetical protein
VTEAKFMSDRVAEAIERVGKAGYGYAAMANAAILAMREPTDAMMKAGSEFVYEGWASTEGGRKSIAEESWQAMIDAAIPS